MWVQLGLAIGAALSTTLIAGRTRRSRRLPLPKPGGPPADRAEAVRRVVKHLVRRPVADLVEGVASVTVGRATAVPGVPLWIAPFTGVQCIGYHVTVRTGDVWSLPLFDDARCTDFDLRDASGTIRVRATGIELAITKSVRRAFVPARSLPWLAASARRRPTPVVELYLGVLLPGAELLVCGVPAREPIPTDYRDGAIIMELIATPTFPLVASPDSDLFAPSMRPIDPSELR